jgi:hypothetical protein
MMPHLNVGSMVGGETQTHAGGKDVEAQQDSLYGV